MRLGREPLQFRLRRIFLSNVLGAILLSVETISSHNHYGRRFDYPIFKAAKNFVRTGAETSSREATKAGINLIRTR